MGGKIMIFNTVFNTGIEHRIGEEFEHNGVRLRVTERTDGKCRACYFYHWCTNGQRFKVPEECTGSVRKDNKGVIFKQV